ncbi:ThiF family adenylyltransferase [Brachybacterium sp. p3-SID1565]|uniref:ThiF family adenylyltransferase n=1 Tax=Brachybacterium sp. p3-SID1565 TaxID=2916046 RepID=UPI0021A8F761|nr:ThiF family adenylyltransferase [Brachybacterium sp. p3-SID1565]MCT1385595.1 ThiF family adenylyltransferase [Brachybacterium sp. p3-SID1565]
MRHIVGESGETSQRYSRQMRLPQVGAVGQEKLGSARVAVIGAGGLGAPVLSYLAAAGIGSITVIDADTVDLSNLHRQVIHRTDAVGQPKAVSAVQHLQALNPEVELRAVVDTLTPANALEILGGHDLVLDGTDNFPTRYLASDACEILDLPLVWGSILGFTGQVSLFHGAGGTGVTYRDVHPVPPRPGEVPSCSEAGVLGMLCGVIGSTMAMEAAKHILGVGETLHGRIALYDALAARWTEVPVARDPGRAPVTELEDLTLTCGLPGPTGPATDEVTAEELAGLLASGVRVIDIREDDEVARGMLAEAEHMPMGVLLRGDATGDDPDAGDGTDNDGAAGDAAVGDAAVGGAAGGAHPLQGAVLYCAAGTRSASTQRTLAGRGITVRSLAGGFEGLRDRADVLGLQITTP